MANKLVLIEYTEDVDSHSNPAAEEPTKIKSGTQRWVDARSAKVLTGGLGNKRPALAKLVGDKDEKSDAREVLKTVDAPAPASTPSANSGT